MEVTEVMEVKPQPPSGAGRGRRASETSGTWRTETSRAQVRRDMRGIGSIFGDFAAAVAKFDETLVILPPTTKQITSCRLSQYLSFVIPAFVLATTTLMNLTFEQTFTMAHKKNTDLVIIISAVLLSVFRSHTS